LGGEAVTEKFKEKISELLNQKVKIMATYALTESKVAWPECFQGKHYHTYPDMEFIEIVDRKGNRLGENEIGEIVYTSLDFRGSVLLRYKTGDLGKIYYSKCPYCKRTVPRIDQKIERISNYKKINLKKIKSNIVNLNLINNLLNSNKKIKQWQLIIKKKKNNPYELDELILNITPKAKINFQELKSEIQNQISLKTNITIDNIIKKSLSQLNKQLRTESELKEKKIIDLR